MQQSESMSWKRNSVEAIVIVVSILLAFSIDAWWDNRQESIDEQVVLEALLADLQDKREGLPLDLQYNGAILDATLTLLKEGGREHSELSGAELDNLIETTWWWNPSSDWDSPPIQALFAGDIRLIKNQQLVQKISELQVSMSKIQDFYRRDEYVHQAIYTPFLSENAYMPQLINAGTVPGFPDDPHPYPDIDNSISRDHTALLRNEQFHNMLVAKMDTIDSIIRYGYAGVDEQIDTIIEMLESELSKF